MNEKEVQVSYKVYVSDLVRAKKVAAQRLVRNLRASQPEVFRELLDLWEQREARVKP